MVCGALSVAGCSHGSERTSADDSSVQDVPSSSTAVSCGSSAEVPNSDLPEWTHSSGVPGEMPGILSDNGAVVAYPFARPLLVDPPADGPLNKVLLFTRDSTDELDLTLELDGSQIESTRRLLGAPRSFPGYLNVDRAGCWLVRVEHGSAIDEFSLRFVAS